MKHNIEELRTDVKETRKANGELKSANKQLQCKMKVLELRVNEGRKVPQIAVAEEDVDDKVDHVPQNLFDIIASHQEEIEELHLLMKEQSSSNEEEVQKLNLFIKEKSTLHQNSISNLENEVEDLRQDISEKGLDVAKLTSHVENIENVIFCHQPNANREAQYKWVLTNYANRRDDIGVVESPIFYPQINGYSFKLIADWCGENKETLGLYLKVCRGRNTNGRKLEPFRVQFRLDILHKYNGCKRNKITFAHLEAEREDCFVLSPGQNEAEHSYGNSKMLTVPELDEYVINDSMFITCSFLFSTSSKQSSSPSILPFMNW